MVRIERVTWGSSIYENQPDGRVNCTTYSFETGLIVLDDLKRCIQCVESYYVFITLPKYHDDP